VLIYVQVPHCCELKIEPAVTREELQHVIQKTNSSGNLVLAATFDGECNPNLGFRCLAM
jgi:hypothetical protein